VTALGNQQIMDTGYRKSGRCTIDTPSMAAEVTRRWGARFGVRGGRLSWSCTNPAFLAGFATCCRPPTSSTGPRTASGVCGTCRG
jgi:hypothetical protein